MTPFFLPSPPSLWSSFSPLSLSPFLSPPPRCRLSTSAPLFLLRSGNPFSLMHRNPAEDNLFSPRDVFTSLLLLLLLLPSSPLFPLPFLCIRFLFGANLLPDNDYRRSRRIDPSTQTLSFPPSLISVISARFKFRESCYGSSVSYFVHTQILTYDSSFSFFFLRVKYRYKYFSPFHATANDLRARQTIKKINLDVLPFDKSIESLLLFPRVAFVYFDYFEENEKKEFSLLFCFSTKSRSFGEIAFSRTIRENVATKSEINEGRRKRGTGTGIYDGNTRSLHKRNVQGGSSYSDGRFRGSHIRFYRVSPSPLSRRIERYDL